MILSAKSSIRSTAMLCVHARRAACERWKRSAKLPSSPFLTSIFSPRPRRASVRRRRAFLIRVCRSARLRSRPARAVGRRSAAGIFGECNLSGAVRADSTLRKIARSYRALDPPFQRVARTTSSASARCAPGAAVSIQSMRRSTIPGCAWSIPCAHLPRSSRHSARAVTWPDNMRRPIFSSASTKRRPTRRWCGPRM